MPACKPDKYDYQSKGVNMFLTIGLVIGFVAGWYVNEKFEDVAEASKKLKFWKK